MKSTFVITLFAAAALVASVSAHAEVRAPSDPGPQSNSAKLNGTTFNGRALNGPGLVLQGRTFNGVALNGPGLVLQGNSVSGVRMPGSDLLGLDAYADDLTQACMAPQPAREWPLSALRASDVHVRLATR